MALDQNVTPSATETAGPSAIENELPAYRAINPQAVLALICGLLAFLSFANWFFLILAAAAVALGLYADARIRRDPEIWTGRTMAQAGTALGLTFGLAAVTTTIVQDTIRDRQATQFVRQYLDVLKKGSLQDVLWYTTTPEGRAEKSPAQLYKELRGGPDPSTFEMTYGQLAKIKDRIDSGPDQEVHFVKIESSGVDRMETYAYALLDLHGSPNTKYPEKEQFALLAIKSRSKGKPGWWIETARFPYEPATHVHQEKPVDDGHGHAH